MLPNDWVRISRESKNSWIDGPVYGLAGLKEVCAHDGHDESCVFLFLYGKSRGIISVQGSSCFASRKHQVQLSLASPTEREEDGMGSLPSRLCAEG